MSRTLRPSSRSGSRSRGSPREVSLSPGVTIPPGSVILWYQEMALTASWSPEVVMGRECTGREATS
jgi:hypothetical protein